MPVKEMQDTFCRFDRVHYGALSVTLIWPDDDEPEFGEERSDYHLLLCFRLACWHEQACHAQVCDEPLLLPLQTQSTSCPVSGSSGSEGCCRCAAAAAPNLLSLR